MARHALPILLILAIGLLAGNAMAEELSPPSPGIDATVEEESGSNEDARGVFALALIPALLLLVAMPVALYVATLAPDLVERAATCRSRRPVVTFLLGLGDTVALLAISAALAAIHPTLGIIALLIAAALLAAAVVGLVGTARDLGDRLLALGDRPASPLRKLCWGWLLLAGIPLLPILGALVLLYLAPGAVGAGHLAIQGGGRREAA